MACFASLRRIGEVARPYIKGKERALRERAWLFAAAEPKRPLN
jgi:hypothetical protein